MAKYIKVKKLNLLPKDFSNSGVGFLSKMMGVDPKALENLPEEEVVAINSDKIVGISQKMHTGIEGDERICCKLYFNHSDYWAIKYDNELEETLKSL